MDSDIVEENGVLHRLRTRPGWTAKGGKGGQRKQIKRLDPRLGVIMITGVMNVDVAKKAIALGAYDYITKPVDFEYLESVLMAKLLDLLG